MRAALSGLPILLALLLYATVLAGAPARPAAEPERIAVALVQSRDLPPYLEAAAGFQKELEAHGFKPFIATYDLKGDRETARAVMTQLRRSPPDLILTLGTLATQEVSREIQETPIVFALVLEPGTSGLAAAGQKTGRNVTGVSMDITAAQQLDAVKAVLPDARRIGALYNPAESARAVALAAEAARARGLTFIAEPVRSERDVPRVVGALSPRVDALLAMPDATVYTESSTRYLLLHTLRQAQPFIGLLESFVRAGALTGLTLDYRDLGRQAGGLAVRIRQGEAPGQIVVQDPRKTRLILNLRTARRIGVKIPAPALQAAEVLVP